MKIEQAQLWLGSQASYEVVVEALAKMSADSNFKAEGDYDEDVMRKIYNVQDGVATINVSGSLINGSAGYAIYYGITGYDDIRAALVKAVSNQNVSSIILNVSSGGGHVAGCHETAQLIARVNKVKPVVTYTGSTMGSAAVWTGCAASYIVAGETATVGSIGIIMVHMEKSKMLEDMGVKATVIRAGAEKALASPYEPLSDKAKENLQAHAAELYDIFIKQVAESRGVSVTTADTKFGQGREFLGKAALAAGLVDKVGTYEDAFAKAMALGTSARKAAKPASRNANSGNVQALAGTVTDDAGDNSGNPPQGTEMKTPLTQEQLAAMAAGVDLEAPASEADSAKKPEASANAESEVQEEEHAADSSAKPDAALAAVKELLAEANSELVAVKVELEAAKAGADMLVKFSEIARASVKTMGMHFGVKSEAVAAMSNTEVLAEHTRLAALFKEKFKVGSVAAAPDKDEKDAPAKASMAPAFSARAMSLVGAK